MFKRITPRLYAFRSGSAALPAAAVPGLFMRQPDGFRLFFIFGFDVFPLMASAWRLESRRKRTQALRPFRVGGSAGGLLGLLGLPAEEFLFFHHRSPGSLR
ncbi:MAG TPA: hypothetical protein VKR55_22360 [Bradyrhizobium sp.]|uniref:hypothetical protein n=1 Tax=Bradyrhizobium sp. TaxID=376 RepID=UPI002C3ABA55|nr:hypothetical protein [Bradyrhizobium sp.]HLZ04881.1 hypothetical protein [Bradyrhizobium sp.]